MPNSTDSLNEIPEYDYDPETVEFIMLENRCSYSKAIVIYQECKELRERRANELTNRSSTSGQNQSCYGS